RACNAHGDVYNTCRSKGGQTWGVYAAYGSLFCRCVDYRSAQRLVARMRRMTIVQRTLQVLTGFALLVETPEGWQFLGHCVDPRSNYCDNGRIFLTRAEAEAWITG